MKLLLRLVLFCLLHLAVASESSQAQVYFKGGKAKRSGPFVFTGDPAAPLTGNLTFGVEHTMKDKLSWKIQVGYPGVGYITDYSSYRGWFAKAGIKSYFRNDFAGMVYTNDLEGWYAMPQVIYSQWENSEAPDIFNTADGYRMSYNSGAFLICIGRQRYLFNLIAIDMHLGLGLGYIGYKETYTEAGVEYAIESGDYSVDQFGFGGIILDKKNLSFTFGGGLDIGIKIR
jgi:hypothetical protein